MTTLVVDIEADGLLDTATKIHCIVAMDLDTGRIIDGGLNDMLSLLETAETIIMHMGFGYDLPLLTKLHPDVIIDAQIIDTLVMSREWWPDRPLGHSLDSWCEELGATKPKIDDWSDQPYEVYLERCREDVRTTAKLYQLLIRRL